MEKVKSIGGDVGNDSIKIVLEEPNYEGKNQFEVMNIIAPGYNRRMLKMDVAHLSNLLDVNIYIDGEDQGRYFIGGLAVKENKGDFLEKTRQDTKATNKDTIYLLMSSIAYALYDPQNPVKVETIALGSLLPTEEYFAEDFKLLDEFEENFKKQYKIKFNHPAFNKAEITINIVDTDIEPEGAAGLLSSVYELNGNVRKGMENLENETYLGIFIGSVTTEVAILENGEFNSNGFFGQPLGTSEPIDNIISDLGVDISRHRIDYLIRNNKQLVANSEDLTEKLQKSKEQRFSYFTKLLINRIYKKLDSNGINTKLISKVLMGGGGAITIQESFNKEFNLGNIKLVDNPRYANATGALLSIMQKRKEQEAAADEVLS